MTLTTLLVFACTSASAQQENRPDFRKMDKKEMIKHQTDRTAEELSLTAPQADALLALNTAFADKLWPSKEKMNRDQRPSREEMEAMRKEMQKNREAYNAELKKILTEEQYEKYQQKQQERLQHSGKFGRGNHGEGHRGEGHRGEGRRVRMQNAQ